MICNEIKIRSRQTKQYSCQGVKCCCLVTAGSCAKHTSSALYHMRCSSCLHFIYFLFLSNEMNGCNSPYKISCLHFILFSLPMKLFFQLYVCYIDILCYVIHSKIFYSHFPLSYCQSYFFIYIVLAFRLCAVV